MSLLRHGILGHPAVDATTRRQPVKPAAHLQWRAVSPHESAFTSGPESRGKLRVLSHSLAAFSTGSCSQANPPVQPATRDSALRTHVACRQQLTLMGATVSGRQRKQESLQNLERDRSAFLREPAPQDRKIPVSLHFFAAEYQYKRCGELRVKTTTQVVLAGQVPSLAISINETHVNELALRRWLWKTFYPGQQETLLRGVEHWQVCTHFFKGSKTKGAFWVKPQWDQDGSVSIVKYKDQVHDGEGVEKYPKRSDHVQRSTTGKAKSLGIFLVLESRHPNDVAPVPPLPAPDSDGDNSSVVTPRRRRTAATAYAASTTTTTVSAEATSSTAPTTFAPSTAGRPSTATSFLDLTGLARSGQALTKVTPTKISVDLPALNRRDMGDHDSTWIRSPDTEQNDDQTSVSEYGRERFPPPGNLVVRGAGSPVRRGSTAGGQSDVYEIEEEDFVTKLIGRKRKRAKPSSTEADGGPKRNKGGRQTRSKTPSVDAFATTRQSGRLLARVSAD